MIARQPDYRQAAELLVQAKGGRAAAPAEAGAAPPIFSPRLRYGLLAWAASGVALLLVALFVLWFQGRGEPAAQPAVAAAGRDGTVEALAGTVEANAAIFAAQTDEAGKVAALPTNNTPIPPSPTATATEQPVVATPLPATIPPVTAVAASVATPTKVIPPALMATPLPELQAAISPDNAAQVRQLAQWGDGMLWGNAVTYSPDGQLVAIASTLGLELYEAQTMRQLRFIPAESFVQGIAFSADSALLAAGSLDGDIRVWQVADGALANTLEGHTDAVTGVAFSPNGALLASASNDDTVRLWPLDGSGEPSLTLTGHTGDVNTVAFSPGGSLLVSGSDDNTVRLWQVKDGALLDTLEGHTRGVLNVAFAPDGATFASGGLDGTVRLWQLSDGSLLNTLEGRYRRGYERGLCPG